MMKKDLFIPDRTPRRRRPQQQRAEKTVERITEATLRLVLQEGYSTLNVNRVADEAKVNISSLYQYFPNKFSIVLAIYEGAASELASTIHKIMMEELDTPMEIGLARIVKTLIAHIDSRQGIFLRLEHEVPELRQTATQMSFGALTAQVSYVYLRHHLPEQSEASIRARLFFCRHMAVALVHAYLVDRPAGISRKRFIAELTRVVFDCLQSEASHL